MAFAGCRELTTVYYEGTKDDWENISIKKNNDLFVNANRYYYSDEKPTTTGKFWHYGENGEIVVW